jgi:hypothetical protein
MIFERNQHERLKRNQSYVEGEKDWLQPKSAFLKPCSLQEARA